MTDVYDLDALETEGLPFRFRHGGQVYEMPPDIDLSVIKALDFGDVEHAFGQLLGADSWKAIIGSGHPFGIKKLKKLLEAYAKHLGVESLGGFSASADSSPNTAER